MILGVKFKFKKISNEGKLCYNLICLKFPISTRYFLFIQTNNWTLEKKRDGNS
jgi:hypothetical protein